MNFEEKLLAFLPKEEVNALLESMSGERTYALVLNTNKMSDEEFVRRFPNVRKHPFLRHSYLYNKEEYEFGKHIFYECGVYSIQDPSAMMVPHFLDCQPGEVVLDICAAPGGKSIGMALQMQGEGVLVANDASYPRAKELSKNIERMGLGNVIINSSDFIFAYGRFPSMFDRILVDAPCSGTAMFRKNELAKEDWTDRKVLSCVKSQLEILEEAYFMLKEGGTIAYSTCSFCYEEDEGVIEMFKERHPEIEILDLPETKDNPCFYHGKTIPESVYFFPHRFEGEGQFVCLFKKPGVIVPTPKKVIANMPHREFLRKAGMENRSNEAIKDKMYSMSQHFDVSHFNILRYGVKLFELGSNVFIPDHHLSHYLGNNHGIEIDYETAKKYIHGETFPLDLPDGFYIVDYEHIHIGWVKVTQKVAKNHYPKGLRKQLD